MAILELFLYSYLTIVPVKYVLLRSLTYTMKYGNIHRHVFSHCRTNKCFQFCGQNKIDMSIDLVRRRLSVMTLKLLTLHAA